MSTVRLNPSYTRHPDTHRHIAFEDLTMVARDSAGYLSVQFVKRTVAVWKLAHLASSAELVVSQLVARAVKLTGKPTPPPLVGIRLTLTRRGLLVEVWDSNSTSPLPAEGEYLDDHLSIVQEVCQQQRGSSGGTGTGPRTAGSHSVRNPRPAA